MNNSICKNCKFKMMCNCSDMINSINGEYLHPEIFRDDITKNVIECIERQIKQKR